MLLFPTLLSLSVANSSLLCWLLISFCACACLHVHVHAYVCMRAFPPRRVLQSHWCLHQSKYSAHDQHIKAIKETRKTIWLRLAVKWYQFSGSNQHQPFLVTGLSQQSHAVVLQNESVPSPTARNPSLASSCQMEVTAKGQIFFCYQHALIDLCPPKAQNSSSSSALRPQAVLGPGANKTLKPHNWDHSAQYSLSLYSPQTVSYIYQWITLRRSLYTMAVRVKASWEEGRCEMVMWQGISSFL